MLTSVYRNYWHELERLIRANEENARSPALVNVHAQQPPDKKKGDDHHKEMFDPLAWRLVFGLVSHAWIVALRNISHISTAHGRNNTYGYLLPATP